MDAQPLSLAHRLGAAALVFVSEPDAFGIAPETWTTPHLITYGLLLWLFLGVFADRRVEQQAKRIAIATVARALPPKTAAEVLEGQRMLDAIRALKLDPQEIADALQVERDSARSELGE